MIRNSIFSLIRWSYRQPSRRVVCVSELRLELLERRDVPAPLTPLQVRHAYGFDQITFSSGTVLGDGAGQTIAIVDAYDDPNIASDLATFDSAFGLAPPPSFVKATPQGLPAANAGWSSEIALDVEWAHAIAPKASILLVEAKSSGYSDLLAAVDYAAKQSGVSVVSMSWGSGEFRGETSYDSHFRTPSGHAGVTFVASSGDNGAPPSWPAISPNVLGVGGTSLNVASDGSYVGETGWSGSGGGKSTYESKPTYQTYVTTNSTKRSSPDVAYNADPNTGVYVYDTMNGGSGWWQMGGTSAGAPQWAALVAIANEGRALTGATTTDRAPLDGPSQTLYAVYKEAQASYSTYFHDVTSGNNGYSAGAKYDFVTGLGTPLANKVVSALTGWKGSGSTGSLAAGTGTGAPSGSAASMETNASEGSATVLIGGLLAINAPASMQSPILQVSSEGSMPAQSMAVAAIMSAAPDFMSGFNIAPFGNYSSTPTQMIAQNDANNSLSASSGNSNSRSGDAQIVPLPKVNETSFTRWESEFSVPSPEIATDSIWDSSCDLTSVVVHREFISDDVNEITDAEVESSGSSDGE